jgi:hypothetical protein
MESELPCIPVDSYFACIFNINWKRLGSNRNIPYLNQRYLDKGPSLLALLINGARYQTTYGSEIEKSFNWSKTEFNMKIGQNATDEPWKKVDSSRAWDGAAVRV